MEDFWFIPPSDFLSGMTVSDKEELISYAKLTHFKKGECIFKAGDPGNNVYILEDGRAKICQLSVDGKEMILWFCLPGEMFGLAELPRESTREVFAQVCTDSEVYSIPRQTFNMFMKNHPDTAMQVVELLSCRLRVLGHMLLNLASDDVTSRIIKLILRLSIRGGNQGSNSISLEIPLTHQEIAEMIGASRQTVTSVLSKLRRQGVLNVVQHRIQIQDKEKLNKMIDDIVKSENAL